VEKSLGKSRARMFAAVLADVQRNIEKKNIQEGIKCGQGIP
jgi:hypothetical protein